MTELMAKLELKTPGELLDEIVRLRNALSDMRALYRRDITGAAQVKGILGEVAALLDGVVGSPGQTSGRLTFCEKCNANRIHYPSKIVNGVQHFECPECTVSPADASDVGSPG